MNYRIIIYGSIFFVIFFSTIKPSRNDESSFNITYDIIILWLLIEKKCQKILLGLFVALETSGLLKGFRKCDEQD